MSVSFPLLAVDGISVIYPLMQGFWKNTGSRQVLDCVSIAIHEGESVGLVGESGSGKSTLAKVIMRLKKPNEGEVSFQGKDIFSLRGKALKGMRRQIQMIFQDPAESLNPRHTVESLLAEPFIIHGIGTPKEQSQWVDQLLDQVGLPASSKNKYPFEFSGGQKQRIGIARAIALKPKLIVCDEPTSALDVSIQAQILNLLSQLKDTLGISFLFISHDLAVVRHMCSRIAVMQSGKIIETGPTESVLSNPSSVYMQKFVSIARSLN